MQEKTIHFKIYRSSGISQTRQMRDYQIRINEAMTVLDALEIIRLTRDKTLKYRHSCHHSCCGTCACLINGKEKLTCITNVFELDSKVITLEPLRGLKPLGDLVVDMQGFYPDIPGQWTYLKQSEGGQTKKLPRGKHHFERLENCIECGACYSACPVIREHDFMGPAALAACHNELLKNPAQTGPLLSLANGTRGQKLCQRSIDCSRVCPSRVFPARHILDIRKKCEKLP